MLNQLLNKVSLSVLRRKMKTYLDYPAAQSALVLIDVQPAFLAEQPKLSPKLAALIAYARWHNIAIVHSHFGGERPSHELAPGVAGLFSRLDSATNIAPLEDLLPRETDTVLPMRTTLGAFADGALESHLRDEGIEHVVLAGSFADLSIDTSAREASEYGFHTTVLSDCCGATSTGAHHATMDITLPRMVHSVMGSKRWFRLAA